MNNYDLVITRVLRAPAGVLFQAWTDPGQIKRWWSPKGFTVESAEIDLRIGGEWRVRSQSWEGKDSTEQGTFREVSAPDRLGFTFAWVGPNGQPGHETLVTVDFQPEGERTKLAFKQSGFLTAESRDDHAEGWAGAFDLLTLFLEGGSVAPDEPTAGIYDALESRLKALRAKKVNEIVSHYTDDVLLFDLTPPLVHNGPSEIRKGLEIWLPTFTGTVGYEVHDLKVTIADSVALTTSFDRISGDRTDGTHTDVWVRATMSYRRENSKWKVAHEHLSVPFYMDGSYKAALDLKPAQ